MWDKSSVRRKRGSDNGRRGTMSDGTKVNFFAFLVHRNLCLYQRTAGEFIYFVICHN